MAAFLSLVGWESLDEKSKKYLLDTPRSILIYPHTSFYDFVLYAFYFQSDPILKKRSRILVNPFFTDKFQWALQYFGSIPATRRDEKNGGGTKRICEELNKEEEFLLILSPKGSMESYHEWRTGFYYMAKELNCPVIPAGLDFEKKKFVLNEPFSVENLTVEEACIVGKERLKNIIPRNPEKSEFPLGEFDAEKVDAITPARSCFIFIIVAILIVLIIWWFCYARYAFGFVLWPLVSERDEKIETSCEDRTEEIIKNKKII